MIENSVKSFTVPTYVLTVLSIIAIDFVLLAIGAACAFSSAETSLLCEIPDIGLWALMMALPILFLTLLYQLRKRNYWKTTLWISASPLVLLSMWIAFGILMQVPNG